MLIIQGSIRIRNFNILVFLFLCCRRVLSCRYAPRACFQRYLHPSSTICLIYSVFTSHSYLHYPSLDLHVIYCFIDTDKDISFALLPFSYQLYYLEMRFAISLFCSISFCRCNSICIVNVLISSKLFVHEIAGTKLLLLLIITVQYYDGNV